MNDVLEQEKKRKTKTWMAIGFLVLLTIGVSIYFIWLFGKTPSQLKAVEVIENLQYAQEKVEEKEGELYDIQFHPSENKLDVESEVASFRADLNILGEEDFKVLQMSHTSPYATIHYTYHTYPQITDEMLSDEERALLKKVGIPSLDELLKENPQKLPLNKLTVYQAAKGKDRMHNMVLRTDSLLFEDYQDFLNERTITKD